MASLNVAEWTPDQAADWLTGLGPTVSGYVEGLRARGVDGRKLLMLRCDDLHYLGVTIIGHQELILEAVEHLRNFQYELSRECIQQLALRVSVLARALAAALRAHTDARLDTQTLADVARVVHAVKPLVCWLDRWPACGAGLAERKAALLKLSLEAATCAQRDRFAEHPARAVAAAAATAAAQADYIVQKVYDPLILTPASLDAVCVRQRGKALGFEVVPSYCGHHQLADIRFGSPAHASGLVHEGDEIVQVGNRCVIGWSGAAVRAACSAAGGAGGELALRLRRRGARPPALAPHPPHTPSRALYLPVRIDRYRTGSIMSAEAKEEPVEAKESAASSSDESEPPSPPASPALARLDRTRTYAPKPRLAPLRRHTVSGGSVRARRPAHPLHHLWHRPHPLRAAPAPDPDPADGALYARDKAVSYGTGLETSRPRTSPGSAGGAGGAPPTPPGGEAERARGKLDKAHSTPAYDLQQADVAPHHPPIPESPPAPKLVVHSAEKADQILQFKKSSSQIGEAMQRRPTDEPEPEPEPDTSVEGTGVRDESTTDKILETINIAMMEHRRRSLLEARPPPPAPPAPRDPREHAPAPHQTRLDEVWTPGARPVPPAGGADTLGVLRAVPRAPLARDPVSPLKPHRPIDANQISLPLRHITEHDIRMLPTERREPPGPLAPLAPPAPPDIVVGAQADTKGALSPTGTVRGIFPTSKSRSLKKKSSILAKRRGIPARALAARGAAGAVWQRVRARHHAAQPRWARRHLLLAHNLLYAYKTPECSKADCMIYLEGFTACAAGEVKSRAHAFKVYHTGTAFYFACDTRDAMLAWIQLIHRATLLPSLLSHVDSSNHFSETDYSETESDTDSPEKRGERERDRERDRDRDRERDRDRDKDKSKFGSLKKLTGRVARAESQESVSAAPSSLDRKYLRFFRTKPKDDNKHKSKQSGVPVPTEQYRSYRRAPPAGPPGPPDPPEARPARKLPKPINYIHASNPNLLDFEKSDFVTKPSPAPALHPRKHNADKVAENAVGLVTLEQFMLQKQAEERRQLALYSDRVLLGVQADHAHAHAHALHTIVADVIYGEVGAPGKPISVKGKDGYEKIVYPDECGGDKSPGGAGGAGAAGGRGRAPSPPALPWRDSLRRNDKVHNSRSESNPATKSQIASSPNANDTWNNNGSESQSGPGVSRLRLMFGGGRPHHAHAQSSPVCPPPAGGEAGVRGHYPHLQCPPVFHAETYSLCRPSPAPPRPARDT